MVTSSGMHGSVAEVDDNTVSVTVATNTTIKFDKSAIASVEASLTRVSTENPHIRWTRSSPHSKICAMASVSSSWTTRTARTKVI